MIKKRAPTRCRAIAITTIRYLLPVLIGGSLTLGGCAEIARVSADDANQAASIAAAVGDAAGAACWPMIAATANAIAEAADHPGILAAIEENRAVKTALANPACQPIWAEVLADLLKLSPPALLIP
jgi:hypothetical protein